MAIGIDDEDGRMPLLNLALNLHNNSLDLALKEFGERNVLTAKHYGNLGRLYQTLCLFSVFILLCKGGFGFCCGKLFSIEKYCE